MARAYLHDARRQKLLPARPLAEQRKPLFYAEPFRAKPFAKPALNTS